MNQLSVTDGGLYIKDISLSDDPDTTAVDFVSELKSAYHVPGNDFNRYLNLVSQLNYVLSSSFSSVRDLLDVQSNNPHLTPVGWTYITRLIKYAALLNTRDSSLIHQSNIKDLQLKIRAYYNFPSFKQDVVDALSKDEVNRRLQDLKEINETVFDQHKCNHISKDLLAHLYPDHMLLNQTVRLLFI